MLSQFSATFACAAVDALIDEALEGQDVTGTTLDCSTAFFEVRNLYASLHVSLCVAPTLHLSCNFHPPVD